MNIYKTLILFSATCQFLSAQTFSWAKQLGGPSIDIGYSIAIDGSGNVYTTGEFQGVVDFDPGPGVTNLYSSGDLDAFITKFDALGNFIWAKKIGGTFPDQGYGICTDPIGNVYTIGSFQGTADFDPGAATYNLTPAGNYDIFISKLDSNGNFLWAKKMGGTLMDIGYSIVSDSIGSVYAAGIFRGTADFDPSTSTLNLISLGGSDIFVSKFDSSGAFQWAKQIGGISDENCYSIALNQSGHVLVAGSFQGTVDFDPGPAALNGTALGYNDGFILKMDGSGSTVWVKTIGSPDSEFCRAISIDPSGNILVAGSFSGTTDFDPGPSTFNLATTGYSDGFITKLDPSGNFLWAKSMGGGFNDNCNSIATDNFGNAYSTGKFFGTADFDPGTGTFNLTSTGTESAFISKLDSFGNFSWAKKIGGVSSSVNGHKIVSDAFGNIYTTGFFTGTTDFDPDAGTFNLTPNGGFDSFVHKISQCAPSTGIDIQNACDSFSWINGNTYTISNNTATHTLISSTGCDSVVTLNLTLSNSNTGTDQHIACSAFTWIDGKTYTSSNNTAQDTLINTMGCDSILTLNLTINQVSNITTTLAGTTITASNTNASFQWLDCANNYAEIPGETNQSFSPTSNGLFAVQLTENGCSDTSACVSINSVGLAESGFGGNVLAYPNPTSGIFAIHLGSIEETIQVTIYNLLGKLVDSKIFTHSQVLHLSIEGQPRGMYFISLASGDRTAEIRLLKE